MVAGLLKRGELSPPWREAFDHVARHEFIPDTMWRLDRRITDGPDLVPVGRAQDPEAWLVEAYKNVGVPTQVDDGHPDEHGRGREITSSASMPAVVAQMLTALDVRPGMRVLEIGTGTGYNAALLAYRLGAEKVTSVEIDPTLAKLARTRLHAAGFAELNVLTGDGAAGHQAGAPYDRVLATVAVRTVPYAWITQTRPGGVVLTPWGSEWYSSALLKLTTHASSPVVGDGDHVRFIGIDTPEKGRCGYRAAHPGHHARPRRREGGGAHRRRPRRRRQVRTASCATSTCPTAPTPDWPRSSVGSPSPATTTATATGTTTASSSTSPPTPAAAAPCIGSPGAASESADDHRSLDRLGRHGTGARLGVLRQLHRRSGRRRCAPLHTGDPGYRAGLDRDLDGVACE